jgi:hypothetical protein
MPTQGDQRGARQPDLKFWQGVFDHARGIGLQDGSMPNMFEPSPVGSQRALGSAQSFGSVGISPEMSAQPELLPASFEHVAVTQVESCEVHVLPSAVVAESSPLMSGALKAVSAGTGSGSPDRGHSLSAGPDRSAPVLKPMGSFSEAAQAGIRVHVAQMLCGDLKVTLRAHRGLSVAQALAAAGQATHGLDPAQVRIREVMLNGVTVHGEGSGVSACVPEQTSFEFRC